MKMIASSRLHSVHLLILLTCLCLLAQPLAVMAQTDVPAPLPPAAQETFDKGIMAAREQGYLVAIRYLQEARKQAPQAPQIFRSLGAVEAKISGRELRAMAWYGAYLAALPQAPDAAEVKNEIGRLEVKSQIHTSNFIKTVQDAAQVSGDNKDLALVYLAGLWAKAGDIEMALKTAEQSQTRKGQGELEIVKVQLEAGDIAGAQRSANFIKDSPFFLNQAQLAIAETQITANDIAEAKITLAAARRTADLFEMPWSAFDKSRAETAIAEAQIKVADIAGARQTLASALKSAENIEQISLRGYFYIAQAQLNAGDIAGAQKTTQLIPDGYEKSDALKAIAKAQVKDGDMAGAQKTLDSVRRTVALLKDAGVRSARLSINVWNQLEVGDIAGAQQTADLIQEKDRKADSQKDIAKAKELATAGLPYPSHSASSIRSSKLETQSPKLPAAPVQPVITVSDWLKKLDESSKYDKCPLNTGPFLDLAYHLKSLPPASHPYNVFGSLHDIAKTIVDAQNVITGMLKQEARR